MTIVFLMQDTGSIYGAERATLDLILALQSQGVKASTFFIQEERLASNHSALIDAFRSAGLAVQCIPVRGRFSWKGVRALRDFINVYKSPVLHTIGYKADIHGGIASCWGQLFPIVSTVHGWLFRPKPKELVYQWLDLLALRRFTRVIALSHWYEQYLTRKGISHVEYIPTGINAEAIVSADEASKLFQDESIPFTLGMLGRLSWEKNQTFFLQAISQLPKNIIGSKTRFWIAGDGPDRPRLEEEILHRQLSGKVVFKGFMNSRDFFKQVHILIQCSRIENLPYSVLEAMSWMRPVLATQVGGLSEIVRHGETGYLHDCSSPSSLATSMIHYVQQREVCKAHGVAARKIIMNENPVEKQVAAHVRLYDAIS